MNITEKLVKEIDSLIKQITKLKKELLSLEEKNNFPQMEYDYIVMKNIMDLKEKIARKEYFLSKIKEKLEMQRTVYSLEPTFTNNVIDLYKQDCSTEGNYSIEGKYTVCLHSDKTIVGTVGFGKDTFYEDNVHYYIDEEYRNQGLGFQAVCTLLEYLNLNGVKYVTLHIDKTNIASIKIAEKITNIYTSFQIEDNGYSLSYHINIYKRRFERH